VADHDLNFRSKSVRLNAERVRCRKYGTLEPRVKNRTVVQKFEALKFYRPSSKGSLFMVSISVTSWNMFGRGPIPLTVSKVDGEADKQQNLKGIMHANGGILFRGDAAGDFEAEFQQRYSNTDIMW
jgi:hypothetical protein